MKKTQFISPSICPMCGKYIMEENISAHRCEVKEVKVEDYSWIKVKKYKDDETLTWEERYNRLMKHHEEETTFLINEINRLKK